MVRLRGFFDPTQYGGLKKNSIQVNPSHKSNPTHMGWTIFIIIIIIIIKLNRKNININILKKNPKININVTH